jgi:hypothetical protein
MGMYKGHPFKLDPKYEKFCDIKIETIKHESDLMVKLFPNHYEYLRKFYGRD